ncbi:MAG: hypothetical protein IK016_04765 [Lachnospiraceae bacterium]|nr:hypothetical protein [Lachnospiraceae bacterium]
MNQTLRIWYAVLSAMIPLVLSMLLLLQAHLARHRIGRASVKYSIDHLPAGLMLFLADGRIVMINRAMNRLLRSLTGVLPLNGRKCCDQLLTQTKVRQDTEEETNFLLSESGRFYTFRLSKLRVRDTDVWQLTAVDTTDLHETEAELRVQEKELAQAQRELAEYSAHAEDRARNEEYLATKMRIHDSLGQVLLSTRYWLTEQNVQLTKQELLASWRQVMGNLRGENTEVSAEAEKSAPDLQKALTDAAKAMGLSLTMEGDTKSAGVSLSRFIVRAARICMTNAVRHGAATEMTISLSEKRDGRRTIRFANNGVPPRDLKPGGGLRSLEKRAEQAGGSVSYESGETFAVLVTVQEV